MGSNLLKSIQLKLDKYGYGITAALLQASRLGSTLLAASLLGPEEFAPWLLISSIMSYSMFAQLGVTNGLYRELPVALGSSDKEKACAMFMTCKNFLLLFSFFLLALSLPIFVLGGWGQTISILIFSLCLILANQFYNFQLAVSHSYFHFRELTLHMTLFAVALIPLTWFGTLWGGLSGYLVAQAGLMFVSILYLGKKNPRTKVIFDRALLFSLIRTGIPISLIGLLFSLLISMDRWVISYYLGKMALGQYALAVLCVNSLALLTKVISPQFYSRMSFLIGSTGDVSALRRLVFIQLRANLILMTMVAIVFWVFVESVVRQWLPEYVSGVEAARIVMLGVVFLGCVNPFSAMMNASGNYRAYLIAQVAGFLTLIVLLLLSSNFYGSLQSIAWATAIGYMLYMFLIVGTGLRILTLLSHSLINK